MGFQKLSELSLSLHDLAGIVFELMLFQIIFDIVVEIGHLFDRPEMLFWRTVTVKTPSHSERLVMVNNFHVVDVAMTALAGHSAVHMC